MELNQKQPIFQAKGFRYLVPILSETILLTIADLVILCIVLRYGESFAKTRTILMLLCIITLAIFAICIPLLLFRSMHSWFAIYSDRVEGTTCSLLCQTTTYRIPLQALKNVTFDGRALILYTPEGKQAVSLKRIEQAYPILLGMIPKQK